MREGPLIIGAGSIGERQAVAREGVIRIRLDGGAWSRDAAEPGEVNIGNRSRGDRADQAVNGLRIAEAGVLKTVGEAMVAEAESLCEMRGASVVDVHSNGGIARGFSRVGI